MVQRQYDLPTDSEAYVTQHVNMALVDVVYDWARGVSFAEICSFTLVQEGSIVRCITRWVFV
jgi:antiviral helicase SKI2